MKSHSSYRYTTLLAGVLILAGLATSFFTMRQKAPIVDESVHLAAGYSYFATRNFRMNPEHPPLVKEIAALPLLFMHLESKTDGPYFHQSQLWNFGPEFIYNNTVPGESLIYAGRAMVLVFFALLGMLVFRWTRELFGDGAALTSLVLTMFAPNFLAHGSLITTDVPIAFAYLFTCYTLWKYLDYPKWPELAWFFFAFLFATLTKYTTVTLVIGVLITFFAHSAIVGFHRTNTIKATILDFAWKKIPLFLLLGVTTLVGVIVFYGINYQQPFQGEETLQFIQTNVPETFRASFLWFAQNVRVPGYYFFEGLVSVLAHNKGGHDSFLLGDFGNMGWWYYFPFLVLIKTTIVSLLIIFFTLGKSFYRAVMWFIDGHSQSVFQKPKANAFLVLILPLLVFVFFSLSSHINLGVRHFIIFYPFIFILSGSVTQHLLRPLWGRTLLALIFFFTGWTVTRNFPNALAYFNPLMGSDDAITSYIVSDSNVDWGQDLKELGAFVDRNNIHILYLAYFGTAKPDSYGIHAEYSVPAPTIGTSSGYIAISETLLKNPDFASYHTKTPVAILGGSIYVYAL